MRRACILHTEIEERLHTAARLLMGCPIDVLPRLRLEPGLAEAELWAGALVRAALRLAATGQPLRRREARRGLPPSLLPRPLRLAPPRRREAQRSDH